MQRPRYVVTDAILKFDRIAQKLKSMFLHVKCCSIKKKKDACYSLEFEITGLNSAHVAQLYAGLESVQ